MSQDKAPEWAMEKALSLRSSSDLLTDIALALSQAYERGQESMRERAAEAARDDDGNFTVYGIDSNTVIAQRVAKEAELAIRSLPIEQDREEGK